jgi:hypothetical protein
MQYSFCETATASRLHIRSVGKEGRKISGGVETLSLCGCKISRDLTVKVTAFTVGQACSKCRDIYEDVVLAAA